MMVWVVVAGQGSRRLIPRCVVVGSFLLKGQDSGKDSEGEGKREKRGTAVRGAFQVDMF